jgi:hypothetical protein
VDAAIRAGPTLMGFGDCCFYASEEPMAKSTNKSIADHEQTKSHHFMDEERHRKRKKDPKTGKRRNLGTFRSLAAEQKQERAIQ